MNGTTIPASGYGNENWEFDNIGLMQRRIASINDLPIEDCESNITGPLGGVLTITHHSAISACKTTVV